jgi:protein SCO1
MPARARLALMVASILALLGATGFVVLSDPGVKDTGAGGFQGAVRPAIPPQDFALRDQDGKAVSLAAYRGRPVILTFMYSTCRDTCPLTAQQIKGALDDLGHDVPALAVSVDPAQDTPLRAKRFLLRQGLTGRMRFLLGDRAQLEPIWKAYGIRPQGDAFDHSAYVLLIDREGRQRVGWPVERLFPEGLAHDLRRLGA